MSTISNYFNTPEKINARIKNPIRYSLFLASVIMATAMLAIAHARGNGTLTNKGVVGIAGTILVLLFLYLLWHTLANVATIVGGKFVLSHYDRSGMLNYNIVKGFNANEYNITRKRKICSIAYPIIVYGSIIAIWAMILYNFIQTSVTASLEFDVNKHLTMLILLSITAAFLIALNIVEQKMEIDIFEKDNYDPHRQQQLKSTATLYGVSAVLSGLAVIGNVLALTQFREKIPNFEDHSKALLFAATFFSLIFAITAITTIINLAHLQKEPSTGIDETDQARGQGNSLDIQIPHPN